MCRGLDYLASHQRSDGGFDSLRSINVSYFNNDGPKYRTTFMPALIGGALENIKTGYDIRERIAKYLLGQKDDNWSFNYWDKTGEMYKKKGIPNDLDDTFCALSVLYDIHPGIFDGDAMARIVTLLCANEVQPGGPYNTWNSNEGVWKDIDPVVNANISYFLQKHNVHLDKLSAYIRNAVMQDLTSSYYSSKTAVFYFITRAMPSIDTSIVRQFLFDKLAGNTNSLEMALAISTLLRLGATSDEVTQYVEQLIERQATDGGWSAYGLYIDARLKDGFEYAGSSELTTAFCIEAIDMYKQSKRRADQAKLESFKDKIVAQVHDEVVTVPSPGIRSKIRASLTDVMSGSKERNVVELPVFMTNVIKGYKPDQEVLQQLSVMSLWGWIAYTMQDDCLDDMQGADMVPAISFCMKRLSQKIEVVAGSNQEFKALAFQILDIQDDANTWELRNCRVNVLDGAKIDLVKLPNYGDGRQLANRALGHTISAIGIMYAAGFTASSPEFIAIRKFFYHYLLARQLSDDAHDWEDDLTQGHVNYVATGVLKYYILQKLPASSTMNLNVCIDALRKILWDYHIVEISELTVHHIEQARKSVSQLSTVFDIKLLDTLLAPIETAAQKSLTERQKALDFIKHLS